MKLEKADLQLETILSRIEQGELDLQPDFQRGEIWDAKRRQRLIDTVLRQWFVPSVHVVRTQTGEEVVLDGQQRLAAVRSFFNDEFRINGKTEPRDSRIAALDGLRFSQLPSNVSRQMKRFVIQVITLTEYSPEEPNELFFRLNQSYNLTPPEKRNALHGDARDQVKGLVNDLTSAGLLSAEAIGFSNGRLAYDDIIARTCVTIENGSLRTHINNATVEEFYRNRPFSDRTIEHAGLAGNRLRDMVDNSHFRIRFNKGTLQTWLVYCYWNIADGGPPPPNDLLEQFEAHRASARAGEIADDDPRQFAIAQLIALYDDRASYRVTDVSSVLTRDLAIHLFSVATFGSAPARGSEHLLHELGLGVASPSRLVTDYLESSHWGDPLTGE